MNQTKTSCGCCAPRTMAEGQQSSQENREGSIVTTETVKTTKLSAPDIVCGGCANSIKKALGGLEGVAQVDVDVDTKTVTVKHDEKATRERLINALDRAGYAAS